jgi:hypothetical protein
MTPESLESERFDLTGVEQATVNTFMCIMSFTDFLNDQRPPSELKANSFVDHSAVLTETFSPNMVKGVAVGILMKMNQLRQNIAQDRTANSADKSLANMVFLVSSMLATAIGAMSSDPGSVSKNGRFGAR